MDGFPDLCFCPVILDLRGTSVVALTRRAAVTTHGRRQKSKHADPIPTLLDLGI